MKIVECPRDAMQGLKTFIPTEQKIAYLNKLLQVGFDTLDFGSFVSPKAIPQLADTEDVLAGLDLSQTKTKLLAIIANVRGAEQAAVHKQIDFLGFPLSVSEEFQQRNTNKSIAEALNQVAEIQEICARTGKKQVTYISMGFGNPYGEAWSAEVVGELVQKLADLQVPVISLSDTIGVSNRENISYLFSSLIPAFPQVEFGAHLHSNPNTWEEKVDAAYQAGCRRFDGAIRGFGGCPMAKDELVGNLATENLVAYFGKKNVPLNLDLVAFEDAIAASAAVFAH